MTKKKKKVEKERSKPRKTFQITLEIEFTGAKAGVDKRLLDWLVSKDIATMPDDFQLVKVVKSKETELSEALAQCRSKRKEDETKAEKHEKEKRKRHRKEKKEVKEKRKVTRKKARKRAKEK